MWDYSFAIPSLFIIAIILAFYLSLPRLCIRINRLFLCMLVVESLDILLDVVASWVDSKYWLFPVPVIHFLNIGYFVLFFYRIFLFFIFLLCVLKIYPFRKKYVIWTLRVPLLFCVFLALMSPVTGWIYRIGEDGYEPGPFYNILYYMTYFYTILSFLCLVFFRKNVKRRRYWYCMVLYEFVLLVGILVRRQLPDLLLFDTYCIMAVIIVYLAFQNPEYYLERRGGVFNGTAFRDYLEEHNGRLSGRIIGLVVHNYHGMRDIYSGRQMDTGIGLISDYLTHTFRECNIFYVRRGRFLLLCPRNVNTDRILDALEERFDQPWYNDDVNLYLRAGYVRIELGHFLESTDSLLNTITRFLDKADRLAGMDTLTISEEMLKEQMQESTLKRCLENAVENNAVEVFFQPLIDATTGKIVGAEALSRIRDAAGGLILPGAFIPLAEESGTINELGEQVFEKTCQYIADHNLKARGIKWINVNLSPVQFMRNDLPERFMSIVDKYGIDPGMIHLEITEETIVDENHMQTQNSAM